MSYKLSMTTVNYHDKDLLVILEPWAEFFTLKPKKTITIIGEGGAVGSNFDIEYNGKYICIHAWGDSIATAYRDGVELDPEDQIFPE